MGAPCAYSLALRRLTSKELLMSVSGIASGLFHFLDPTSFQSKAQSFQKEFQQLGQDLQSGNLSQAQADFAALHPPTPPVSSSSQSSRNSLASAFQQLSSDLQSGNLSAAQQDYSNIRTDLQQQSPSVSASHHHHHHHAQSSQDSSQTSLNSLFSQLGQALQSGNLSAAQSAYASLQQAFAQFSSGSSPSTSGSTSLASSASISLTA